MYASKGRTLVRYNPPVDVTANSSPAPATTGLMSREARAGTRASAVPLAPNPSRARLIARKAKW